MKRIDRYLLGEVIPPSLLSLSLYIFVLLMNVLFDLAQEAIDHGLSLSLILRLLYYQLPELLVVSLPMAVLLGSLIGIGRLAADSEVVALQAAGVPIPRLAIPVAAWGLAGSLVCFFFIASVAPEGTFLHHRLKREVYLSRYSDSERIVPRVFHDSLPGLLFYYDAREAQTGAFERVFLYESDPQEGLERMTLARRGEFGFDRHTGRMTLYLENGSTHAQKFSDPAGTGYSITAFHSYQESRPAPAYIRALSGSVSRNQGEMTIGQLRGEIRRARAETNPIVRRIRLAVNRTALHERFALPAATFVFALLAVPLGLQNRRGGKAAGFALSLIVLLVYWVLYTVLRDLAETGRVDAAVALWLPNIVFGAVALWFLTGRRPRVGGPWFPSWRRPAPGTALETAATRRPSRFHRLRPRPRSVEHQEAPVPRFPILVDRYVAAAYLRVLVFVVAAVLLVYLLVELRQLLREVVEHGAPSALLWRYLGFVVPRIGLTILPVACLIATVTGLGLMARCHETTALKAAGMSLHRLLGALTALTLGVCIGALLIQEQVLPTTNRVAASLRDTIAQKTPRTRDPRHRWVMGEDSRLYHYESADPGGTVFQGLSIFELDPVTFALRSRTDAARAVFSGREWVLQGARVRTFTAGASEVTTYERLALSLPVTPAFFRSDEMILLWGIQREPSEMSFRDQSEYIRDLTRRGYDTTDLRVALAQKTALPFVSLFMVLLGFPFSFGIGARGTMVGVGLAVALSILYWAVLAVFNALGSAGLLSPVLAAWSPHVFFGGLGAYFSLRVRS